MAEIHLTIGPMGAGKSEWLIRKYRGRQAYGDIVEAFVPDGPAEGDLGSEYLSLCFDEYLPRYQAWRCGVNVPKPEPSKYRPAAADYNLELAGGAHESRDLEPIPRGRVQHGTHANPAPLIPAEYPRWQRPDYSSWTPLQPDSSDPEPIRSA